MMSVLTALKRMSKRLWIDLVCSTRLRPACRQQNSANGVKNCSVSLGRRVTLQSIEVVHLSRRQTRSVGSGRSPVSTRPVRQTKNGCAPRLLPLLFSYSTCGGYSAPQTEPVTLLCRSAFHILHHLHTRYRRELWFGYAEAFPYLGLAQGKNTLWSYPLVGVCRSRNGCQE